MRLGTYITESTSVDHGEIVNALLKDCKPYLKEVRYDKGDDKYLYSGREYEHRMFYEKKIRKNRRPKDTLQVVHDALDKVFKNFFGVKARSESIFVTGDSGVASAYGTPYVIIPKGRFKVIWSGSINDLYVELKHVYKRLFDVLDYGDNSDSIDFVVSEFLGIDLDGETNNKLETDYWEKYGDDGKNGIWTYELDNYTPKEKRQFGMPSEDRLVYIKGFSKSDVEKSLFRQFGDTDFYTFDESFVWSPDMEWEDYERLNGEQVYDELVSKAAKEIPHMLYDEMKEVISTYDYEDDDVYEAIQSGNEIMLSNKSGYYGVNTTEMDVVSSYFKEFGYMTISDVMKKHSDKLRSFIDNTHFTTTLIEGV